MASERAVPVPDIGDFEDVDVIEVLVAVGERVEAEQSLVTLESEKATMEIPSPAAGVVKALHVAVGDKVSEGSLILTLEVEGAASEAGSAASAKAPAPPREAAAAAAPAAPPPDAAESRRAAVPEPRRAAPPEPRRAAPPEPEPARAASQTEASAPLPGTSRAHASPSVRRLAREFGVDLSRVRGSGPKSRILKDDVQAFVRDALARGAPQPAQPAGIAIPPAPEIDFSRWGETEVRPLGKVRRVAARNLHRSWLSVPHVTQFDAADITDLEAFRVAQADEAKARGTKLTLLAFLLKASAVVLEQFPGFNSSLEPGGEAIVVKKYFHLGFAVDTDNGLVVPVIRDVDRKGLFDLALELAMLSQKARDRKLTPEEMSGGSFTISSLGGIGGTAFTPIVNHPEVAILGVSRAEMRPVWRDDAFVPRLLLPLSLSYDHRVIDGADAVRFTTRMKVVLSDIRNLIL
jgi:pyruvate dehydrogenase E2 component (dihydrolipoamide acetyltransferase)